MGIYMTRKAAFHAACYMVIEKDSQILLHLRRNSGYFDGYYSIPAGHLEQNEKCMDCIIRELREETSLEVNKEDLEFLFAIGPSEKSDYVCLFFGANKYKGVPTIMEPDKCSELKFYDLNNLPNNLVPELEVFLEGRKNGLNYSDER